MKVKVIQLDLNYEDQNDINHAKPGICNRFTSHFPEDVTASLYPEQKLVLFSINTCVISAEVTSQL